MSDLRDFTGKNRRFTGTDSVTISSGTTGERVDGAAKIRFNTSTNLMEYYSGTDWKAIDSPPIVNNFEVDGGSTVTSATVNNEAGGTFEFTINGSSFDTTSATVQFIGTSGAEETINTQSITRNSTNLLTVTVTASDFDTSNSPYTLRVTNGSGLAANLEGAVSADIDAPTFTNAENTTVVIYDSQRSSGTIAADDLCGASNAASFAVQSGSLPSGFTLNTSTGAITWSSAGAVGSDTTTTFTIRATSSEGGTADRQFKITVKAPVVESFTSTGAQTFSVPTGISTVKVLVAAGGGGGTNRGGAGGAGGLVIHSTYPVTPGGSVPLSVGAGGNGPGNTTGDTPPAGSGQNSVFGAITASGGGGGGGHARNGSPGGSGGGGGRDGGPDGTSGGPGSQSPSGGGTGYGNPGGGSTAPGSANGGGGGGAGGTGNQGGTTFPGKSSNTPMYGGAPGGVGRADDITGSSTYYSGGGGSGGDAGHTPGSGGQGGGGRGGGQVTAQDGQNNTGGGGGSNGDGVPSRPGNGGPGVVIVRY